METWGYCNWHVCSVSQSYPTLFDPTDPTDCSPSGSSVRGGYVWLNPFAIHLKLS